jgi:surface polysaccharide O-acyltransferase-like enzyme
LFNGGNRELKKKIEEIDFIKGIAIIGVVMVHITAYYLGLPEVEKKTYLFLQQIARYCVPMFFLLSGLLLFYQYGNEDRFPVKRFYKRRFIYILCPFVFWSLFYICYNWIVEPGNISSSLRHNITDFLTGKSYYHLYYLFVLFQFYLLMPILFVIHKKTNHYVLLSVSLALTVFMQVLVWKDIHTALHFTIDEYTIRKIFLTWIFYFCFGGVIGCRLDSVKRIIKRIPLFAILTITTVGYVLSIHEVYFHKHDGFYSLPNTMYSVCLFVLCFKLAGKLKSKGIVLIGKHSFGIYLIHPFIQSMIVHRLGSYLSTPSIFELIAFFLFVLFLSLFIDKLLSKVPYSYLIRGK